MQSKKRVLMVHNLPEAKKETQEIEPIADLRLQLGKMRAEKKANKAPGIMKAPREILADIMKLPREILADIMIAPREILAEIGREPQKKTEQEIIKKEIPETRKVEKKKVEIREGILRAQGTLADLMTREILADTMIAPKEILAEIGTEPQRKTDQEIKKERTEKKKAEKKKAEKEIERINTVAMLVSSPEAEKKNPVPVLTLNLIRMQTRERPEVKVQPLSMARLSQKIRLFV